MIRVSDLSSALLEGRQPQFNAECVECHTKALFIYVYSVIRNVTRNKGNRDILCILRGV